MQIDENIQTFVGDENKGESFRRKDYERGEEPSYDYRQAKVNINTARGNSTLASENRAKTNENDTAEYEKRYDNHKLNFVSDNISGSSKTKTTHKWEIVWTRVLVIGFFHLAGLYGATLRNEACWQSQIFGRVIAVLSSYSVTAGAHRLWSHRSYKANYAYQIMLMLLMSFVYQNSIYVWARDHRVHHKFSETDADPHNAKRGLFFSHVGWLMLKKHPDVRQKGSSVDMTDLRANPIVMFQHRHYHKLIFFNCFCIMIVVPWYFWGESLRVAFFYMTAYRLLVILNCTWGINSLAHMYGYKPYNKNIGPAENSLMSYLTFGEGFHNYHHTFPRDYRAGEYSTDGRNTTTKFIDFFAWIGWVCDRRMVDGQKIAARKSQGDAHDTSERGFAKTCKDVARVLFMCLLYGYVI